MNLLEKLFKFILEKRNKNPEDNFFDNIEEDKNG